MRTGSAADKDSALCATIILAAGGTGGHMAPADALADRLTVRGYSVHLITDDRGTRFDNMLQGVPRTVLSTTSHQRSGIWAKLLALLGLLKSIFEALRVLRKTKAAIVVGFGGYPSAPSVVAARLLRRPYVLHDQNAVLGKVNRWMAGGAAVLALSYNSTRLLKDKWQTVVTGNPARQRAVDLGRTAPYKAAGVRDSFQILVVGGSQGARLFSQQIPGAVSRLPEPVKARLRITQQARPEDLKEVRAAYQGFGERAIVETYFEDIPGEMAKAQLVIARAGASTIAELYALARPSILVPLAIAANDHQRANAAAVFKDGGAVAVLEEKEFTEDILADQILDCVNNSAKLQAAADKLAEHDAADAGERLADLVIQVMQGVGIVSGVPGARD